MRQSIKALKILQQDYLNEYERISKSTLGWSQPEVNKFLDELAYELKQIEFELELLNEL